jgi:hypothetical protein
VGGERYWVTREGLVFPDGSIRTEWRACHIPEGVIFSIRWEEADPVPVSVHASVSARRYRIEAHADCTGTTEEQALRSLRLAERVRDQLVVEQKVPLSNIELVALGCTRPLVSPEVTAEDRKKNRRVEVILLAP